MNDSISSGARFAGMTVNERLHVAGLLDAFDRAIRARDESAAMAVLVHLELSRMQAVETVRMVLEFPGRYGY
jgi:hypothetical protein